MGSSTALEPCHIISHPIAEVLVHGNVVNQASVRPECDLAQIRLMFALRVYRQRLFIRPNNEWMQSAD